MLHEHITRGRDVVVAALAQAIRPLAPGRGSPDPELTARLLSTLADESVRLTLTDPKRYPIERLIDQARLLLEPIKG